MKRPFCLFLLLIFFFGCTPEEEFSPVVAETEDVDSRLNFYWDRFDEYFTANPDSAFFYMKEVKSLAEAKGKQKWMASAYWALGDLKESKGNLSEAIYYYLYAAKNFQEIGELLRLGKAYISVGYIYMQAKNYETAVSYFQKAKSILLYKGSNDDKAMIAHNLGICYRNMGREEEAETILLEGLKEARSRILSSKIHNTLGVLYFKQGMQGKARQHYRLSMEFADHGLDSIKIVAGAYNNIGESFLLDGDYEQAEKWLNEALFAKEEVGEPVFIQAVLNTIGKLKIQQGRHQEAVELMAEGLQAIDPAVVDDAVGESLSLINEALVKLSRVESPENMARLNSQLSSYSQRLVRYNNQLIKQQQRLEVAGRQHSLALSVDKFEQDQKLGKVKEEKEQVQLAAFLIPILVMLVSALILYWFIRRQRRSKAIMGAIEEVLNKSAMRHNKN